MNKKELPEQDGPPQAPDEEEAAEEVSPPQEEIEGPTEQDGPLQEEVMVEEITPVEEEAKPQVKIRCISKYTRVNEAGEELETYDDVPYGRDEDIYEVDEDLAKELLATKHFVPVT